MICVLLVCLPVACNICLIFVKSMDSHTSYCIMDQSHLYCFKKNTLKVSSQSFYQDQMKIPTVHQCRYLGITISTNNSDVHLKRQMRKLYANVNLLLRKFSKCSVDVKCFLFKTYCSNLYCAPMWIDCKKLR